MYSHDNILLKVFLECERLIHFLFNIFFPPPKIMSFMKQCGKSGRLRQTTDDVTIGCTAVRYACRSTTARLQTQS